MQDVYELPPDNIRGLIINAVVNCSFLQGSLVQVAIYDNRLKITSPGWLMPDAEFIDMGIALRVNMYRAHTKDDKQTIKANDKSKR